MPVDFVPANFPFSPKTVYADSEKEERAKVFQAVENTVANFGWDTGRVEETYRPGVTFIGKPYGWSFYTSNEDRSVNIDVTQHTSAERAQTDFERDWLGLEMEEGKYMGSLSFQGYPAGSYTASQEAEYYGTVTMTFFGWVFDKYTVEIHVTELHGAPTAAEIAGVLAAKFQEQGLMTGDESLNHHPTASFYIEPEAPTSDDVIICISTSSDQDGDQIDHDWYLDNAHLGSDSTVSLGRLNPGEYTVTLNIDDGNQGTDSCYLEVTVDGDYIATTTSPTQSNVNKLVNTVQRRQELMQQEEAVKRQEKIKENEETYQNKLNNPFDGEVNLDQLEKESDQSEELVSEIEDLDSETDEPTEPVAYIFIGEMSILHKAAFMFEIPEIKEALSLGYRIEVLPPTDENLKRAVVDGNRKAIAYFGHGSTTIAGKPASTLQRWLWEHQAQEIMNAQPELSREQAITQAMNENPNPCCNFEIVINASCYSLGTDDQQNTTLADVTAAPGGIYMGAQGKYHPWSDPYVIYERPGP
ncbi:MAG: hypothetical protein PVJ08_03375 [Dehalococcoidia bacterium]